MADILAAEGVTRDFQLGTETVRALDAVDVSVRSGEFLAVIGPSGSGKTTLLTLLGLLDVPTAGLVRLRGADASTLGDVDRTGVRRRAIGFVFQHFSLVPTLTARENVELPGFLDRKRTSADRAKSLLDRLGMGEYAERFPEQLSGGQRQRIAIARALFNQPDVVLADEPTGNLDRATGERILAEFASICARGVAVVAVTHDPAVEAVADRTVELVDGRIVSA